MIYITDKAKNKLSDLNKNNYYVIADFDKTLTSKDSNTTFSLFSKSGYYNENYIKERNKNYEYYRPLELNPNITDSEKFNIVKEWQEASYKLMLKYKVHESDIKRILKMEDMLKLRDNAVEFINYLNNNNIPLIISSAGIGNFIIELLKLNNCYSDNICVYSNMLEFKDDIIVDSVASIIHSMNKNDITLINSVFSRIQNKKYAIIIGDQLSDLEMAKSLPKVDTISFGFLEANINELQDLFMDKFDIVLKDNETFDSINKI